MSLRYFIVLDVILNDNILYNLQLVCLLVYRDTGLSILGALS